MKKFVLTAAIAAIGLLTGVSAHAGIAVTMTFDSYAKGSGTSVTLTDPKSTTSSTGVGGVFTWTPVSGFPAGTSLVNSSNQPSNGGNFITFCAELTQEVNIGSTYSTYSMAVGNAAVALLPNPSNNGTMGTVAAEVISYFWSEHITDALSGTVGAGAFQLVVWKLDYDKANPTNGFNLSAGNLTAGTGADATLAQKWLNSLAALVNPNGTFNTTAANALGVAPTTLVAFSNPSAQDQIGAQYPTTVVPEPGAMIAWSIMSVLGLVGYAVRRRPVQAA